MSETCATCKFFQSQVNGGIPRIGEATPGICHRYPPLPVMHPTGQPMAGLAVVFDIHWCGEHKVGLLVRA